MKKTNSRRPSRRQAEGLRQICELIPGYLVGKLARQHGVDGQARSFSAWSHVVAMLYAQLSRALSLNDVCDGLRLWCTPLAAIRGASAPSRNALSHANRTRDCAMAQALFWQVLEHLQNRFSGFGQGSTRGMAWRFRRTIHVVDATVIQLVASCMDWARHKRRKAAAKCHLRLSLRTLLPNFVVIGSAREGELTHARALYAGLRAGEIVLFDRGYHRLTDFWELDQRGVFFVTRPRPVMKWRVVQRRACAAEWILTDELIMTSGQWVEGHYPQPLRRVTARVRVDGQERIMEFLTNNLTWSATTVAELYRCRWQIEAFFKQIKQTLQLADFLGHNANAVHWQVWMALLVYVLLRFHAWACRWPHSFTRLFTLLRSALWLRCELSTLLKRHGTAHGRYAWLDGPTQPWLPGLAL